MDGGKGFRRRVCAAAMLLAVGCGVHAASNRSDFDGDGKDDILSRNASTAQNYIYFMDGTKVRTAGFLGNPPGPSWNIAGVGDFDGDGKADILWRNSATGENYLFLMSGTTVLAEGFLKPMADLNWNVAGIGDFDGDGKADILWRNSATGENYMFLMNGTTVASEGFVRQVADLNWNIAGVGDFNRDGKADILWRNSATGENYLFFMEGIAIRREGFLRQMDLSWNVAGVGDFDGDGRADILWRNSASGQNYLFPMRGRRVKRTEGFLRTVEPDWQVQAVGDYDGDGRADILWRNSATGDNEVSLCATNPALAPLPLLLWSASMETGDLSEWSEKVNSGSADTTVVTAASAGIPPKDGSYVMMQAVTGALGGTRMQRYPEVDFLARAGATFYWSWWDYFPTPISFGISDTFILFGINSRLSSDAAGDPFWSLVFHNSGNTLDLVWSPNKEAPTTGPHAGESGRQIYNGSVPVPVGQWNFFEVMVTPRGDFTGALKIRMNGQVLFDQSLVKTMYPDVGQTRVILWLEQTSYGSGLTPTPAVNYIDDVTLSLGRMPQSAQCTPARDADQDDSRRQPRCDCEPRRRDMDDDLD
jgi:VCBS repeat protein